MKYHFGIMLFVVPSLILAIAMIPGDDLMYLWSMATGYVSIILLAATLMIGPVNVITRKSNPITTDLRRDIGIWCGLVGLTHIFFGIQVHMANIFLYFFREVDDAHRYMLREDLFGLANYVGLLAGLILIFLIMLSSDISMKWLKPRRWKNFQRLNYLLFILILAHGAMYQVIEKRAVVIIGIFAVVMIVPVIWQWIGFRIRKRSDQ